MPNFGLGIDIGGTQTKMGLVDLETGAVVDYLVYATEKHEASLFLNNLYLQYNLLLQKTKVSPAKVLGLGIGVPGFVNDFGVVESTFGFLSFMEDYPLQSLLQEKFQFECKVDNDARVVGLGESFFGSGKDYKRVLTLTLGTGVGFSWVVDGKFIGNMAFDHMAGHITIHPDGPACYCGKKGCAESLVSATALVKNVLRNMEKGNDSILMKYGDQLNTIEVLKAFNLGDGLAVKVVNEYVNSLKTCIDNFIYLYAPDVIVLAGGLGQGLSQFIPSLQQQNIIPPFKDYLLQVKTTSLGAEAGIIGAALLILKQ
jgi:glucokinase